jgi:hypothetical protein
VRYLNVRESPQQSTGVQAIFLVARLPQVRAVQLVIIPQVIRILMVHNLLVPLLPVVVFRLYVATRVLATQSQSTPTNPVAVVIGVWHLKLFGMAVPVLRLLPPTLPVVLQQKAGAHAPEHFLA